MMMWKPTHEPCSSSERLMAMIMSVVPVMLVVPVVPSTSVVPEFEWWVQKTATVAVVSRTGTAAATDW
ncbi:hypothetical protein HanIR_Chr10g0485121 [Helianthus annuus]|nr:hypothetical protein HanIR_Chr10g0485121 [Helianthus annuus]